MQNLAEGRQPREFRMLSVEEATESTLQETAIAGGDTTAIKRTPSKAASVEQPDPSKLNNTPPVKDPGLGPREVEPSSSSKLDQMRLLLKDLEMAKKKYSTASASNSVSASSASSKIPRRSLNFAGNGIRGSTTATASQAGQVTATNIEAADLKNKLEVQMIKYKVRRVS